ncbi:THO complex subunit 6 homolog isoform X2 [Antedon mediterranea]|uniref:THO complex subunit 6 homolog isoform X2 n=1 Tax=Antedon mediterranea TaxID=105859 RepID=UPI003AF9407E
MTTTYQCFSPCGNHLVTANNYGTVSVFNLTAALSPNANESHWKPSFTFQVCSGPIYSIVSTELFLICAGTGDIKAYKWTDILKKSCKIAWTLSVPTCKNQFSDPEVNSIVYNTKDNVLYSGCGDKNNYSWDLESGTLKDTFSGHSDYIHCVALFNNSNQFVSSSEDGSVRIWDCRGGREAQHVMEPYKHEECCRPQIGRWVSCVSVDPGDDWLVCGGGVALSTWHLRSLSTTCIYNIGNSSPQCLQFHDDLIYCGGTQPKVSHLTMNGEVKTQVPCTPNSVFSLAINTVSENNKVLSVSGSSSQVDIFTNFGYRAFSLQAVP